MKIDIDKQIDYWLKTAKDDFETALLIFNGRKNYHHSCFFCHLVVEKTLKALFVKNIKKHSPLFARFNSTR
jgi:HEPN domain-containing protein